MRQLALSTLGLPFFLTAFVLGACDDDPPEDVEDPGEHACEQLEVAATELTASAVRDETAPAVEVGAAPYEVTLPAGAAGYLRLEVSEDSEVLAFLQDADVLAELYHGDSAEGVVSSGANEHCSAELAEHFHLDLHEAGTYYLELGPTVSERAWLLLSSAEGHVHQD